MEKNKTYTIYSRNNQAKTKRFTAFKYRVLFITYFFYTKSNYLNFFFTIVITICAFILYVFALNQLDYSFLSWKIIQKKKIKDILVKTNFEKLAENQLK